MMLFDDVVAMIPEGIADHIDEMVMGKWDVGLCCVRSLNQAKNVVVNVLSTSVQHEGHVGSPL
jgi:hypothetical protein